MPCMKSRSLSLVILGEVVLAWLVGWVVVSGTSTNGGWQTWGFGSDSEVYWDLSSNLLKRGAFECSPGLGHEFTCYPNPDTIANVHRLPAYPAVLAFFRFLWDDFRAGYLLNFVAYLLTVAYAVYLFRLLSPAASRLSLSGFGCFVAFSPLYLVYNQGIQSDTFCAAMCVAFTYHFLRCQSNFSATSSTWSFWIQPALAALFGSVCLLSRANAAAFLLPLTIIGVIANFRCRGVFLVANGIVLAGLVLAGTGWMARNYHLTGKPTLSVATGHNLYLNYVYYFVQPDHPAYPWRNVARHDFMSSEIYQQGQPLEAEAKLGGRLQEIAWDYIREHPRLALRTAVRSVTGLFIMSYFDIVDILVARIFGVELRDGHYVDAPALRRSDPMQFRWLAVLGRIHSGYKYALLLSLLAFPWAVRDLPHRHWLLAIWASSGVFIVAAGLVIASGDRLRLPVHWANCIALWLVGGAAARRIGPAWRRWNAILTSRRLGNETTIGLSS